MDLYDLHKKPSSLKHYDVAHEKIPKYAWGLISPIGKDFDDYLEELRAKEDIWAKDPHIAYLYAKTIRKPFPKGEPVLAKSAQWAFLYTLHVTRKPFPAAEKAMLDGNVGYDYAMMFMDKRWPAGEKKWLEQYAKNESDAPDMLMINDYIHKYFPSGRWPELERALIKARSANRLTAYAKYVLRNPFPEAEKVIAQDPTSAFYYAQYVLNGPFPAGEKAIMANSKLAAEYKTLVKNSKSSKKR